MLVEEGEARILVDPGSYSDMQNDVRDLDSILITHEHQDHLDMGSLKAILQNNPEAKIMTNAGAGKILVEQGIEYQEVRDRDSTTIKDVLIEVFGKDHALIHSSIPVIPNTGLFIANRFFYPGDAFVRPYIIEKPSADMAKEPPAVYGRTIANMPLSDYAQGNPFLRAQIGLPKPVEILALPVTAPWMRSAEGVDYAAELKPRVCIPVHDGMLKNPKNGSRLAKQVLEPMEIEIRVLEPGERATF